MTIAEIRDICLSFPAITEDIKWENHLCFNIGGKMFLVTAPDNVPVSASFKTSVEDFEILRNRAGFIPAPYMAHNKWIFVDDINRFSKKEWANYLRKSYDLILSKLSLKFQKEVAGGKSVAVGKKIAAKKTARPTAKKISKKVAKPTRSKAKKKSVRKKSKR